MPDQTVGHLLQSCALALAPDAGDALLSMALPGNPEANEEASEGASIGVERGERYAVSRGLAVVPVRGLLTPNMFLLERYLGWSTYQGLEQSLSELSASDDVNGIVLSIDCPGGMVLGIEGASSAIASAAAQKPVHALVDPMAASAAYWLASQATEVVMTPGSIAGSIGVRLSTTSPQQPDRWGDQWFEISSSHARAKKPDPATDAGMAELRRSLDESEARFHAAVASGRGLDPSNLLEQLSVSDDPQDGGAVFGPEDAIARGLADRLETRGGFFARMAQAYAPPPRPQSKAYFARAAAASAQAEA